MTRAGAAKRYYPVFLDLENERALVIGEGRLAEEKAAALRASGALVEVVPAGSYGPERLDGVRVAIDTSGDDAVGERVFRDAEARAVIVNVLDRPRWCRFIAPAVVDRHPLQIAVSTAGESPYLAAAVRRRLEVAFGAEWSAFTALVGGVRRALRRGDVSPEAQAGVYARLLASPIRDLLREGRATEAEAAAATIADAQGRPRGRVTIVGAGPGDPALLTLAAVEALSTAELVLHDALVSPPVLAYAAADAELVPVGKRRGLASARQEDINRRLVEAAESGRRVVRLKGGDPFVFGRGGEELDALLEAGIETVVVPGVSAAVAAPAAAGIPLTMRGIASSVAFVTATADGKNPVPGLRDLAVAVDTLVVLMPVASLDALVAELVPVLGGNRPAAVVARATLPGQVVVRGPLADIARRARSGALPAPATLVIGEVVDAIAGARPEAAVAGSG